MTSSPNNVLWLDFETTGLMTDPATVPLEGAAIITDGELNELTVLDSIVIHASPFELSAMDNYVYEMHSQTGLLESVRASTVTRTEFDLALRDFAAPHFPSRGEILDDGKPYRGIVIGGNSVKFDFDVIEKFFPETRATIDYRVIDISGVGELVKRWNRPAWEAMPAKLSDHTAMMDIREGVKELRYYRQVLGA
ncbi:oligoribonuclease [Arthrobacter sp. A2-55]|uniref:oligoribonuclease n=1 Tax=Arthrobacter sp. A2-55 TaxID=2897337 RepID=UPI0021CD7A14|nr:oligoribonuclease [Arthrobacter sp. A2-55]MCU6481312.1 oligoribonuclease [Arthrobacter sp. A2-55]